MKLLDWITIFVLFIIVIAFIVGAYQFYKIEVNECTSDPFVYGAKQMEALYKYEVSGLIYLNTPIYIAPASFGFNSNNVTRLH